MAQLSEKTNEIVQQQMLIEQLQN